MEAEQCLILARKSNVVAVCRDLSIRHDLILPILASHQFNIRSPGLRDRNGRKLPGGSDAESAIDGCTSSPHTLPNWG